MYKLINDPLNPSRTYGVIRLVDNVGIPFEPANSDYQAYLKWVAEGGQVLPADEEQA